ncbi:MAG TPA: D-aminoacyl-tRNA deacylase [Candidatus Polarisedimenticolia bacterium]|nr:D-aminoacyl-tRNA deacylase [Candidatus Polarisedimenticolia bacterium]
MIIVLQRVARAAVRVGGQERARIGPGLLLLVGVEKGDDEAAAEAAAAKAAHLRIFAARPGEDDRMDKSVLESGGEILVVSQFTLAGSTRKGRRPGFDNAAAPAEAERIYLHLASSLSRLGARVQTGVFRAVMEVELVNDGPVTFVLGPA